MTIGWRSRFMAPVYALVISFVLVAILGFALNDPLTIKFMIPAGESTQHVKELSELRVSVSLEAAAPGVTDGGQLLEERQLGPSREFTMLNPHQTIRICTMLPPVLSSAEPADHGRTCWKRDETNEVVINLTDQILPGSPIPNGSN